MSLFDSNDAVLADLLHDVGDDFADFFVVTGDGGDGFDLFLLFDRLGHVAEFVDDGAEALVEAALEGHRVGPGGDVAQALGDDGLGEDGGGGGSIASDIVGADRDLFGELCAHVAEGLIELDLAGDGDAVIDDQRGAEFLVEDDVAAARAEGDLDGVGEGVDTLTQCLARVHVERELLTGHDCSWL